LSKFIIMITFSILIAMSNVFEMDCYFPHPVIVNH
jgi:hypothetical protein